MKKSYRALKLRETLDFGKAVLQNLLRLNDPELIHQSDLGLCEDGFSVIIYTPTGKPDEWLTATFMLGLGATEDEWDKERVPFERRYAAIEAASSVRIDGDHFVLDHGPEYRRPLT